MGALGGARGRRGHVWGRYVLEAPRLLLLLLLVEDNQGDLAATEDMQLVCFFDQSSFPFHKGHLKQDGGRERSAGTGGVRGSRQAGWVRGPSRSWGLGGVGLKNAL